MSIRWNLPETHDVLYHNKPNADAEMTVLLSCIKPNIKGMYRKVEQRHSSNFFKLENIIFLKNYTYITTMGLLLFKIIT